MLAKRVLSGCILGALILTVALAFAQSDDREPAPRFHAKTLEGEQFTNDSIKGKVVLFQFWTTWCPYWKGEESLVNGITTQFAGKGLVVIAVAGNSESLARLRRFGGAGSATGSW